jgi:hopanoid biosynthesis associated protein HpnK
MSARAFTAPVAPRRLIINADDFGRSDSINAAVIRAHREGVLTTASLMPNETASAEAVALAKENPRLGIGLHLTLLCGHSALPADRIPQLVNGSREFPNDPVAAGCRYFFRGSLRPHIAAELAAQFEKVHATGLPLDHVNGHLHLHLHPVVFSILMQNADAWGIRRMRLVRDPFWLNTRLSSGRWFYRASYALVYSLLSGRAVGRLPSSQITHTRFVFGLLQNGQVDERYLMQLLERLPAGDSELYRIHRLIV